MCCHRSSFSPPCRGSGAVIWNEAVWCVVSDGLLDTAHILFFVPAEDGGWRLIPTSYSLEVPYAPPRLKRTEISWWVFVVAHIYLHLFCSTGRTADCCLLMCLRGRLQESCWFHRLKAGWNYCGMLEPLCAPKVIKKEREKATGASTYLPAALTSGTSWRLVQTEQHLIVNVDRCQLQQPTCQLRMSW